MAVSAIRVSNNILKRAFEDETPMSPMRLQRVLYFVTCEYAQRTGKPLLDEDFEAWEYGPVIRSLHNKTNSLGGDSFQEYLMDANNKAFAVNEKTAQAFRESLDLIWEATKGFSHVQLARVSTKPSTAWFEVTSNAGFGAKIPFDLLKKDLSYQDYLCLV